MERTQDVSPSASQSRSWLKRWNSIPLYFRILISMAAGLAVGMLLGERAAMFYMPS